MSTFQVRQRRARCSCARSEPSPGADAGGGLRRPGADVGWNAQARMHWTEQGLDTRGTNGWSTGTDDREETMKVTRVRRMSAGRPRGTEGGPGGDPQTSTSHRVRILDPCSSTLTIRPSLFPQLIVLTVAAVPIVPHSCPSMLTSCNAAGRVFCCAQAPTGPRHRGVRTALLRRSEQHQGSARLYTTTCHATRVTPPVHTPQAVLEARSITVSTADVAWRSTVHHGFASLSVAVHEPAP